MRSPSAVIVIICALALLSIPAHADRVHFDLPAGTGRDLIYGHCQTCHDLQSVVDSAGIRRGAWDAVLDNMKGFGLRITDDQRARILEYLGSYLGPNPPPEGGAETATANTEVNGPEVFANTCIACHQEDGKGKPGEFPPLAQNADLFLSKTFPASVAINGIEGPIEVNAQTFDNVMPSFDFLSDDEIAVVLNYVRSNWGNDKIRPDGMADITASDVGNIRAKPVSATEVHALRNSLMK